MEENTDRVETPEKQPGPDRASLAMAGAALVVLISVVVVVWAVLRSSTPGEDSAEAGFARDMSEHHDQAVQMAMIIQQRTDNEELRFVVTDMALTQQAQIGQMRGWLDVWGLHPSSDGTRMAWMGHETTDPMPGMATPEQINELSTLPVDEAEGLFLELMIIHHQAGIEMADAALDLTDNSAVHNLAESISRTQASEIENMQRMRENLGLERVDVPQNLMEEHDHD